MQQNKAVSTPSFLDALPAIRRRITISLFASQSLFSASQIASFTLLSILSGQLGGGDSATGIGPTMLMIGRAAAGYPIGWLMDRIGRRFGLSLGYFLAAIGSIGIAMAISTETFIGFCFAIFLTGMGRGVSEQARFVAAEVQVPERRANVIGWIVFAGTIGAIGGPLLVAPSTHVSTLYGLNGNTGPYLLAAGLTFISMFIAYFMLRPDPLDISKALTAADSTTKDNTDGVANTMAGAVKNDKTKTDIDYGRSVWTIFAKPRVQLAMISMVLGQLTMNLLMVIAPVHMDHHGHGPGPISIMIMAHTLGMFGTAGITGWLVARYGAVRMIVAGSLVLMIAAIITPLSADYGLMLISMFLLGLGWSFCFISGSTLLSKALEPSERGRIQGASETMIALAAGSGSAGTGLAFAQGGITFVLGFGIILAAIPLIAVFTLGYGREVLKFERTDF